MKNLTTRQVVERYGVSTRTLGRLKDDGELTPVEKLPGATGSYLYDPDQVADFFAKRPVRKGRPKKEAAA